MPEVPAAFGYLIAKEVGRYVLQQVVAKELLGRAGAVESWVFVYGDRTSQLAVIAGCWPNLSSASAAVDGVDVSELTDEVSSLIGLDPKPDRPTVNSSTQEWVDGANLLVVIAEGEKTAGDFGRLMSPNLQ